MGYRHYFNLVEKATLDKLYSFNEYQFVEWTNEYNIVSISDLGTKIFGFGNYYENAEEIINLGRPLFGDKNLQFEHEEYKPVVVGKEGLLNAIQWQKNAIIKHYKQLLFDNPNPEEREEVYEDHIRSMYKQWKNNFNGKSFAINLDESTPVITTSWMYEYCIFELVRLYKTIDWDKYQLVFLGW